jgi:acetoin utilization deacetylase AcuC-like enzyme
MTASPRLHVVEDARFQDHRSPQGHPERPERLIAVSQAISRFEDRIGRIAPVSIDPEAILRVHDPAHLRRVEAAGEHAPTHLDPDTYLSAQSLSVARLAAGSSVDLCRRIARGELHAGIAAVRPPGHHAESDRAMGFCLFNNVAIAARALQAEEGVGKLLVFDWDVHHGNGTQHSFEDDPSILYVSTHQYPHYPGTGSFAEAGTGAGLGSTINLPMPPGCGDAEYVGLLYRVLAPIARRFAPDMILISCGFDAHRDDPLAGMELTGDGYLAMTRLVRALAEDLCEGRIAFVLEGGYAASGLIEGTSAVLEGMLEEQLPAWPSLPDAPAGSTLRAVLDQVIRVHGARHPDIGAP